MQVKEYFLMAFRDLWRRKGRTTLTALGITIGTVLIVTMVSLGSGLKEFVLSMVNSEGNVKTIEVQHYRYYHDKDMDEIDMNNFEEEYFKKLDNQFIKNLKGKGNISEVKATISLSVDKVISDGNEAKNRTSIIGYNTEESLYTKQDIQAVQKKEDNNEINPIIKGESLKVNSKNEALVSQGLIKDLSLSEDSAIGKYISIVINKVNGIKVKDSTRDVKIIGIINEKYAGQNTIVLPALDAAELKGLATLQKEYFINKGYDSVQIIVDEVNNVQKVSDNIKDLDFQSISQLDIAKNVEENFSQISLALTALGVIVLFVAAIGIINTMGMAIYERRKSIGVMKAVGASQRNIKSIFLVQSSAIGFLGGLIGILVASGINLLLQFLINSYIKDNNMNILVNVSMPWYWIVSVLSFAIAIALISGLYPAAKAAELDPIEALRG